MKEDETLIQSLFEKVIEYVRINFELIRLKSLEKTSEVVSTLIPGWIIMTLTATFFLFINLGLAFWFSNLLNSPYLGFFVVASFYLVAVIILRFILYKWLKRKISDRFISKILN
jgi:hypothetical protein